MGLNHHFETQTKVWIHCQMIVMMVKGLGMERIDKEETCHNSSLPNFKHKGLLIFVCLLTFWQS